MTPLERRALGLPYVYNDPAIIDEQYAYQDELAKYNRTFPSEHEKKEADALRDHGGGRGGLHH